MKSYNNYDLNRCIASSTSVEGGLVLLVSLSDMSVMTAETHQWLSVYLSGIHDCHWLLAKSQQHSDRGDTDDFFDASRWQGNRFLRLRHEVAARDVRIALEIWPSLIGFLNGVLVIQ